MPLRCVSPYKTHEFKFEAGQLVEGLTPAQEAHLLVDSPGCFEQVGEAKAAQAPEVKAVLEAPASKAVKRGK